MNIDIRDMLDNFSDDTIELKSGSEVSQERILLKTMQKIEEEKTMTKKHKITSAAIIAAAITALLSISVFAAYQIILSPREVIEHTKDYKLAEALENDGIMFNTEPQQNGDYTFELLGIVSGKGLSTFVDADDDKSYIVGAVRRTDGKNMAEFPGIMVTPLVDGYKPWVVNAFTIGGGRTEFIADDDSADYFIFECSNIEIFADHKIHIAMYECSEEFGMAPSNSIFDVAEDGSISFSEKYTGAHAMFTVPIDPSKANPEAVKELLKINGITDETVNSDSAADIDADDVYFTLG